MITIGLRTPMSGKVFKNLKSEKKDGQEIEAANEPAAARTHVKTEDDIYDDKHDLTPQAALSANQPSLFPTLARASPTWDKQLDVSRKTRALVPGTDPILNSTSDFHGREHPCS